MLTVTCKVHDAEYWDEDVKELLAMTIELVFDGAVTVERVTGIPHGDRQMSLLDTSTKSRRCKHGRA